MVNQIKKNAEDIEQRLDVIRKTTLFKPCPLNQLGELPSCKVIPSSVMLTFKKLEQASTHKSAKTHAGTVFVPSDFDLLTPE